MKRLLTSSDLILILLVIIFSIVLAPGRVLADAGPEEQEEKMRELRQAAAEKGCKKPRRRWKRHLERMKKAPLRPTI